MKKIFLKSEFGQASLHGTIIKMAQHYVGSNNLPLLAAAGQFGTRLQGGEDAASPRYIFTHLTKYSLLPHYPALVLLPGC